MVVTRGVVEIATKNERKGLVFKDWNGLVEVGDLLGDGCNESVESLADLGDGPVEGSGAERSGGVDTSCENSAVNEGFLGNRFGLREGPAGENGGAAIFEQMEVGEFGVDVVRRGFGAAFVLLEKDQVDFFSLDVGDQIGDFAVGKEDVDSEDAEVGLTPRFREGQTVGIEKWNGEGDECESQQLEFCVTAFERSDEGDDCENCHGDGEKLRWSVCEE